MFTEEVVYELKLDDEEERCLFYKFLKFLLEHTSEDAAIYFCQSLPETITKRNNASNIHTVLSSFGQELLVLEDYFEEQYDGVLSYFDTKQFRDEFDELVEEMLVEN